MQHLRRHLESGDEPATSSTKTSSSSTETNGSRMALWGTLRHRMGGSSGAAVDSDAFLDEFFAKTPENPRWALSSEQQRAEAFVGAQLADAACRGVALVTSGATTVPLDLEAGTFIDVAAKFEAQQGPASAEYLLQLGYAVIFLHREDSPQPFTRHFQRFIQNGAFMGMFALTDAGLVLDGVDLSQQLHLQKTVAMYNECKDRLLSVSFTSVQQYLMLVRVTTQAVSAAKNRGMVLLAATLMDFYVPLPPRDDDAESAAKDGKSDGHTHKRHHHNKKPKPKKKRDDYSLNFVRVPNMIRKIRKDWCPKAFLVTCKHQLTDGETIERARDDLEKWGVDVVAGSYHPRELLLISEQEDKIVTCPNDEDLNDSFASAIAELHRNFRKTREILARAKQLLLLSAKFAMQKETDLINEDADGNKNVKFGLGVKICADRREGQQAPVYELKAIFKNKSHCARAHVWEGTVQQASGVDGEPPTTGSDVVVAFSPAGNPETIRDVWGDFWSGWAEHELDELKSELKGVSFSSALNVAMSSISGNYTPASQLIQFMWSKIGHAWSDGEQTRIRQSIQNMIACGLDRGLIEPPGISLLEKLMRRARIQRFDSLALDHPLVPVHPQTHTLRRVRGDSDTDSSSSESNPIRLSKARVVRVHRAINGYMQELIGDGLLDAILKYVERGVPVHVTGYSMGGMLGQLLMLYIGDHARMNGWDASKVNFVGFGSPRVGDVGFAARLRLLFEPEQMLIVMHPSDAVHAFPPTAEGYTDACIKIFLKENGLGVGRRMPSRFSFLPVTKSIDRVFERAHKDKMAAASSPSASTSACSFCNSPSHTSEQHRCRYCIERGSHRGADCPNRNKPCGLCGHTNHCTGEHRCRVCQQYGHRGRECHVQRDVGVAELVTLFRYHHFLYYNSNLKQSVEFTAV